MKKNKQSLNSVKLPGLPVEDMTCCAQPRSGCSISEAPDEGEVGPDIYSACYCESPIP